MKTRNLKQIISSLKTDIQKNENEINSSDIKFKSLFEYTYTEVIRAQKNVLIILKSI